MVRISDHYDCNGEVVGILSTEIVMGSRIDDVERNEEQRCLTRGSEPEFVGMASNYRVGPRKLTKEMSSVKFLSLQV